MYLIAAAQEKTVTGWAAVVEKGLEVFKWIEGILDKNGSAFVMGATFGTICALIIQHRYNNAITKERSHLLEERKLSNQEQKLKIKREKQEASRLTYLHDQYMKTLKKHDKEIDAHAKTKETFYKKCELCEYKTQTA